jgi:outer membrane lipoprotein-sorting protein
MLKANLQLAILLAAIFGLGLRSAPAAADDLESVLAQMDKGAAAFRSAQADFDQEFFMMITGDTEIQKGQIYFHRTEKGMDVAVEIRGPGARKIVFKDGKARMYQPGIDQITEYESGKNKSDIEAFISLGFGGNRQDLLRSYEVKLEGWETIDKIRVARLELIPRQQRMRGMFNRILLWVDPERDVLIRQQLFEVSKDYRLARYSNIKLNSRIPEGAFSLPHAKTVVKAQ